MTTALTVERDEPLRAVVAEEIRAAMARRRLSGAGVARAVGKSQSYVSRRLTGETAFDLDDLEKIAGALGCRVNDFMPVPPTSGPSGGSHTGPKVRRHLRLTRNLTAVLTAPTGSLRSVA